ncbi:metal ABC transporter solute-binding protein, Zn/Mn family [Mesonia sp. HuA40]|uniref:metal ABC transporter solute-binding protein, Zn/Mn family n=1 Tax=Mesonia sp. HuA40 TaxID=2602761 RepID=UPI0011CC6029|nr:zinc ABC transporter substrate-binding protein [Mesonia sp. HuA40]TXK72713.1 manganese transporter [Mesonia sp. HuA40]
MKVIQKIGVALVVLICFGSCKKQNQNKNGKLQVVTTTTMITDLAKQIGGEAIEVKGLMGAGVDPHLYKASAGDVTKLTQADVVFYNGLHLEGKLVDVFEKMQQQTNTVALSKALDKKELIGSENFASNFDPHIWFNIGYWKLITQQLTKELCRLDPDNQNLFKKNEELYLAQLDKLENQIKAKIATLPKDKRILVTAHDAFNYFGEAYGFQVVGLQGLSTATEAGVQDVQNLAQFIIDKRVKAIFIESSVPKRTIEALQKAVQAEGFEVAIGGTLFSDALGNSGTPEGNYLGMFTYNVHTIVDALK